MTTKPLYDSFVSLQCQEDSALIINEYENTLRSVPISETTRALHIRLECKKTPDIMTSFVLTVRHVPGNEWKGQLSDTVSWSFSEGTLTVSGRGKITGYIPYEVKPAVKNLVIQNGITNVGPDLCENCENLTNVKIPNSVKSIDSYAFYGCGRLTQVTIPNSVQTIGYRAFYGSGLTEIKIPESVTTIGDYAFEYTALTDITLPDTLIRIGQQCFADTPYFKDDAHWRDGVLYIGNNLIRADRNIISGVYHIPYGTRCIASCAFYWCKNLTEVEIPNTVHGIGSYAFYDCSGLKEIYIPGSVTQIDSEAFSYCTNIESVTLNAKIDVTESLFGGCEKLKSIDVPETVTTIGYHTFDYCTALKEITLPKSFESVDRLAFTDCSALEKVYYKGTEEAWNDVKPFIWTGSD